MWEIHIAVTITTDEDSGHSIHAEVQETVPDGFTGLDGWERQVRAVGFRALREMFAMGVRLFEKSALRQWGCCGAERHWTRRGRIGFTLATVLGRVALSRQRVHCQRCGKWATPLNAAMGLHEGDHVHSSRGLEELAFLCAAHQP